MGLAHSPRIVTDGLVLCLDAANPKSYPGSGTTLFDLSSNGNDGTLVNGVGYLSDNNGCLNFNGIDGYIQLNQTVVANKESATIMFAVNKSSSSGNFLYGSNFINHVDFRFDYVRGETLNNCNQIDGPSFSFNTNQWIYYGIVFNSSKCFHYLNGSLLGETPNYGLNNCDSNNPAFSLLDNLSFNRIGFPNAYVGYYAGKVSSIFCYNKSLSPNEIKQNFNAFRGRFGL